LGRANSDGFDLGLIHLNSLFKDNIFEEDNLRSEELTVLKLGI